MPQYIITLQDEEREQLQAILSKGKHASQKVINAQILLNCDEAGDKRGTERCSGREIARVLRISERKIDRVKQRFVQEGLEVALNGAPSSRNYERKVDGDVEAHLVALSCSEPPAGRSRWTLHLLAQKAVELNYVPSLSHEAVRQTLKKTNLSHGRRWAG
jgi:transposase